MDLKFIREYDGTFRETRTWVRKQAKKQLNVKLSEMAITCEVEKDIYTNYIYTFTAPDGRSVKYVIEVVRIDWDEYPIYQVYVEV